MQWKPGVKHANSPNANSIVRNASEPSEYELLYASGVAVTHSCPRAFPSIRDFRSTTQRAAAERDAELTKVTRSLASIQTGRLLRADQARLEASIEEITRETRNTQQRVLELRSKVAALRTTVSTRQSNLRQAATILSPHLETQTRSQIHTAQARTVSTENALIATRKVLIRSLVEAFDLREAVAPSVTSPGTSSFTDGYLGLPFAQTQRLSSSASYIAGAGMALFGRSGLSGLSQSITGDSGRRPLPVSKGEWSIAGLVLPVPGDLRRYPPDYVTAAVVHTLHFVRLLTFYLGVKLPFEVTWSGGMPGVGQPTIAAGSGTDRGGWATWTTPYPLYLTSDTPSSDSTGSSSQSSSQRTKPSIDSFTTALCMLNYNIAYLSHTQGLDIPLSLTGETLRNLWTICCITTETFARASHSTPSQSHKLPPPTLSPNFTLDFGQLLQIASPRTASNASSGTTSRSKHRRTSKSGRGHVSDITDEWNLVEIDEGEEDVDEQEQ